MRSILISTLFFVLTITGLSAQDMTLTQDLVLTETMVVDQNTTITGNGFKIICAGCNPVITVEGEAQLMLENVFFPRVYEKWITVEAPGGRATWASPQMNGFIEWSGQ